MCFSIFFPFKQSETMLFIVCFNFKKKKKKVFWPESNRIKVVLARFGLNRRKKKKKQTNKTKLATDACASASMATCCIHASPMRRTHASQLKNSGFLYFAFLFPFSFFLLRPIIIRKTFLYFDKTSALLWYLQLQSSLQIQL